MRIKSGINKGSLITIGVEENNLGDRAISFDYDMERKFNKVTPSLMLEATPVLKLTPAESPKYQMLRCA